ncbi:hypothetical protein BMS3Abin12_00560 [bacterium BMS3Abin12]|nr:hypothetical protein BMS3Abin12_00560 [bacterium BMS3Abin12]
MNPQSLLFVDPPDLADETASAMLDPLYQLTTAFENHYAAQLLRYYREEDQSQRDLFENETSNDELPTF